MNFNTITTLIVSVIVVVLISAAAIVPIVQEAQDQQITYKNNTSQKYIMSSGENVAIEVTATSITINGNDVGTITSNQDALALSDNLFLVKLSANSMSLYDYSIPLTYNNVTSLEVTGSDYSIEYGTSQTATGTVEGNLFYVGAGDYGEFVRSDKYYVSIDESIHVAVIIPLSDGDNTKSVRGIITGTVDDLKYSYVGDWSDTSSIDPDDITVTMNNYELSEDGEYYEVLWGVSITYVDSDEVTWTGTTTGYQVCAPIAYKTISATNSMNIALLGIIPMLIFVIPILLIVRSYSNGRD